MLVSDQRIRGARASASLKQADQEVNLGSVEQSIRGARASASLKQILPWLKGRGELRIRGARASASLKLA